MWNNLFVVIAIISGLLIIYHHIIYPLLLKLLSRHKTPTSREYFARHYHDSPLDKQLPHIAIVMPVHNEAQVIADKIRNLASLDYPEQKLTLTIYADGCTDDTVLITERTLGEPECAHLNASVLIGDTNKGKIAVLNKVLPTIHADLIMLTDASALISVDGLLIASSHFLKPRVGAVSASYKILQSKQQGEQQYWAYQSALKQQESKLGASMGAHGACYFIRQGLFTPLADDTINDDFIIPMEIVAKGYGAVYEPDILALELEQATSKQDYQRRKRIAAGNLQQLIRLHGLLNPSFGATSFNFASGKALRVLMPFMLILFFISCAALSSTYLLFTLLFIAQCIVYGFSLWRHCCPYKNIPSWLDSLHYLVMGHLASFIGVVQYCTGAYKKPWQRSNSFQHYSHIHPLVRLGKRFSDIVLSLIGLVFTALLFPFIAIAIKLTSKGPIFYRQLRVGKAWPNYTELFMIIKFRTMCMDAEKSGKAQWASKNDPRVTKLGRFMRKTRLDELPQFINILLGHMSLIGPRPERPSFFSELEQHIPYYTDRMYGVAPGVTGLAQVNLEYGDNIESVRKKLAYDHAYGLILSKPWVWLVTDLRIMLQTIKVIFLRQGQ